MPTPFDPARLREYVLAHPNDTFTEIARALKISRSTVSFNWDAAKLPRRGTVTTARTRKLPRRGTVTTARTRKLPHVTVHAVPVPRLPSGQVVVCQVDNLAAVLATLAGGQP